MQRDPDAIVVGSGPNGLTAAARLAVAGWRVLVLEAADSPGGGARTEELCVDGVRHDLCSAVLPMAVASPAFRLLELEQHGLRWLHHPVPLSHPLDGGRAGVMYHSVDRTASGLGVDSKAWQRLIGVPSRHSREIADAVLSPRSFPRSPLSLAPFGLRAIRSADAATTGMRTEEARALFAGLAAHSILPLRRAVTAGVGIVLSVLGHDRGWPIAQGGSGAITDALASVVRAAGGEVVTGYRVRSLDDLPPVRAVLADVTGRQLAEMGEQRFPAAYRRRLMSQRRDAGVFKVDWVLDGPIPWADPDSAEASTVHVGGAYGEVAASEEAACGQGVHSERPFVLVGQPTQVDPTRAPAGTHVAWGYCHVPFGSDVDMTERIEAQIERFAPGFRDRIVARHKLAPADLERHNPNLIGGDLTAGATDFWGLLRRPTLSLHPWATPARGVYLCSAATPPGPGVHGMCGWNAAGEVLSRERE